jgi:hypothetical protein
MLRQQHREKKERKWPGREAWSDSQQERDTNLDSGEQNRASRAMENQLAAVVVLHSTATVAE